MHCTVHNVAHNTAQDRPDNFPCYPPVSHHCSDNVYLREEVLWQQSTRCWYTFSFGEFCSVDHFFLWRPLGFSDSAAGDRTLRYGCQWMAVHVGATWRILLNRPYTAATRPSVNYFEHLLWSPYVIGQTIIFLPCDFYLLLSFFFLLSFFLSSPNLSRRRLDVCHTSTHGVALVRI